MRKIIFTLFLIVSGLVQAITEEELIGKYSLYEKHVTVTGVGFGYDYKIDFFKGAGGVLARYQAGGRGVAIDYICKAMINPNTIELTFVNYGEDAEKYGYKDGAMVGDHVLTLKPGTEGDSLYLEVDGELGEMTNPKFYKQ